LSEDDSPRNKLSRKITRNDRFRHSTHFVFSLLELPELPSGIVLALVLDGETPVDLSITARSGSQNLVVSPRIGAPIDSAAPQALRPPESDAGSANLPKLLLPF